MVDLARLLRLKPASATVGEAAARATVTAFHHAFQRLGDATADPVLTAELIYDAHGRAVWRFQDGNGPPGLAGCGGSSFTDVDAETGVIVTYGMRRR